MNSNESQSITIVNRKHFRFLKFFLNYVVLSTLFLSLIFATIYYNFLPIPNYIISTLVIVISFIILIIKNNIISISTLVYVIIFFPALSPWYAFDFSNMPYFSMAAIHLQDDLSLINKTVFLFAYASVCYVIPSLLVRGKHHITLEREEAYYIFKNNFVIYLLGFLCLITAYSIDPGPTLITAGYNQVLQSRFEYSPLLNILVLSFSSLWVLFFLYGRKNKFFFTFVTSLILIWFLLHARRVELIGMLIVLFLWLSSYYSHKKIIFFGALSLWALIFIGEVRSMSFIDYFTSNKETSAEKGKDFGKAPLPGGASNIFISGMHIVNAADSNILTNEETRTILQWVPALIPGSIWKAFDYDPPTTEHEIVFEKNNLQYVGGMPIIMVFYLNGGILLIAIYALAQGYLSKVMDNILQNNFFNNLNKKVSLKLFVVLVMLIVSFRFFWYNPQTPLRVILYAFLIYAIFRPFISKKHVVEKV